MNNRLGEYYNRYNSTTPSEANSNNFRNNNYNNVFQNNTALSVSQEPDITYIKRSYYLVVSSKDRDPAIYPNPNDFRLTLPKVYRNIHSVELIQAILPDKNSILSEPYIVLTVNELEDIMESNDPNISDAFAILMLAPPNSSGGFISVDNRIHENTVLKFVTPKANLSTMTVKLSDFNGTLFNFTNTPGVIDKAYENTFIFKITQLEKNTSELGVRGTFF
jgi:hypothetical protein